MKLNLPVPPSANAMYRAVKGRVLKSAEYRAWAAESDYWIATQLRKFYQGSETFTGPVVVDIAIPENSRRDLDNFAKPILDCIVRCKVIPSDRCKTVRGISLRWHDEDSVHVTVEAV